MNEVVRAVCPNFEAKASAVASNPNDAEVCVCCAVPESESKGSSIGTTGEICGVEMVFDLVFPTGLGSSGYDTRVNFVGVRS